MKIQLLAKNKTNFRKIETKFMQYQCETNEEATLIKQEMKQKHKSKTNHIESMIKEITRNMRSINNRL